MSSANDQTCGCRLIHHERVERARREAPRPEQAAAMAALCKALGDPTRLGITWALLGGEMCVCDLAAFCGLTESAVSHQLRRLKDLHLVRSRRDGQILFYSLDDDHVAQLLQVCREHVAHGRRG